LTRRRPCPDIRTGTKETPTPSTGWSASADFDDKPLGYLGSVLAGMAFGAGWTPCIGPILGSVLLYTSSRADFALGIWLLLAYSASRSRSSWRRGRWSGSWAG